MKKTKYGEGSSARDQECGFFLKATLLILRLGFKKISVTTPPLTSCCLSPQISITLVIMCGVHLSKRPGKLRVTPEELKAKITRAFTNLMEGPSESLTVVKKS